MFKCTAKWSHERTLAHPLLSGLHGLLEKGQWLAFALAAQRQCRYGKAAQDHSLAGARGECSSDRRATFTRLDGRIGSISVARLGRHPRLALRQTCRKAVVWPGLKP